MVRSCQLGLNHNARPQSESTSHSSKGRINIIHVSKTQISHIIGSLSVQSPGAHRTEITVKSYFKEGPGKEGLAVSGLPGVRN